MNIYGVALLSAKRSKDPNTQVGACIGEWREEVIGVGYNGLPKGCSDDESLGRERGEFLDTKVSFCMSCRIKCNIEQYKTLKNCTLYVALFPCHECSKAIIQVE